VADKGAGPTWSLAGKDEGSMVNPQTFVTHSSEETIAKGREIAANLRPPVIVMLSGELGSGKTTLTKGIISGMGAAREEEVTSPTFTLVHVFHNDWKVYHIDLYRIENFTDLESLGLEDVLGEEAVVIIEWPERFTFRTDWPRVDIRLEHAGGDSRRISIARLSL
jgi:tRNA threonylcarbamoyladenosine biosynthesis protein TsaE